MTGERRSINTQEMDREMGNREHKCRRGNAYVVTMLVVAVAAAAVTTDALLVSAQ